ncbi:MAG: hypothetical protein J3Q66DRAFT_330835 [Benniella sp.]|nr:MAG: hypothetical protein J3Q66DRAFT_330835 [Benniella sp.]
MRMILPKACLLHSWLSSIHGSLTSGSQNIHSFLLSVLTFSSPSPLSPPSPILCERARARGGTTSVNTTHIFFVPK